MKIRSLFTMVGVLLLLVVPVKAETGAISPQSVVENMGAGWNLGNTLDAIPTEGSWNNPPVREETFDDIKEAGFESVRIPVTWTDHMGPAPNYVVEDAWMDRVEQVVDWAMDRDFYVVLNVHHDSWQWADMSDPSNREVKKEKLDLLWQQIAERFKDKDEKLLFEVLNEPAGEGSEEEIAEIARHYNDINERVLDVIRSSGGENGTRNVLLPGVLTNIDYTIDYFEVPTDDHIILTVHNYDPWDFVSNWWGKTSWGSPGELTYFDELFGRLNQRFPNLPVVIGEYGTLATNEKRSKWLYHDTFVRAAASYGMATMWWDNGADQFDRNARVFRDPIVKDIIIHASEDTANAILGKASTYLQENEPVGEVDIEIAYNGQSLNNITDSNGSLEEGTDYVMTSDGIQLLPSYLEALPTHLGEVESVVFGFTGGADQTLSFIRYNTPDVQTTELLIDEAAMTDAKVPVSFNGTTLATVKAMNLVNGEEAMPVKDEWTVNLPEDQQGRLNEGSDFWVDEESVYLSKDVLNQVNGEAMFTLEFWPRERQTNVELLVRRK